MNKGSFLKLGMFICFLIYSEVSNAQLKEFHVSERDADGTSVVQANTDYPDNAMLLVYSSMQNLDFRSSIGGINQQRYNQRASRYEILVSPQRQILFVASPGFVEQRVALVSPTPKQVFYFQVEERKGQNETSVYFRVEPKDAQLFIDNLPLDINSTVSAPLGAVQLRLEREGYRSIHQNLVISADQVNYEFKLEEVDVEIVNIRVNQPKARILIDGFEKGYTDEANLFSIFLFPGIYELEIQKSGFIPFLFTLEVRENADNSFSFELANNSGSILFDIEPRNAEIFLNKSRVANQEGVERIPGRYRIEVQAPGYDSFSETIELQRNDQKLIKVSLVRQVGSLQFSVVPSSANVVLRNSSGTELKSWQGLQMLRDLPVGIYTLHTSAVDYADRSDTLIIENNKRTNVSVALTESKNTVISREVSPLTFHDVPLRRFVINGKFWILDPVRETGGLQKRYVNRSSFKDRPKEVHNNCPPGYRLPKREEYTQLLSFIELSEDSALRNYWRNLVNVHLSEGVVFSQNSTRDFAIGRLVDFYTLQYFNESNRGVCLCIEGKKASMLTTKNVVIGASILAILGLSAWWLYEEAYF